MKKGLLIVVDGGDGSGKATQTSLLVSRLNKNGVRAKKIDFPRYEDNFFGQLLGECLAGKYGDFINIPPRIASVIYAADRWESSKQIRKWLESGYVVVADRYASANQIHQGGKIDNTGERKKFLDWLEKMEFGIFGIPKPDIIIYLHVPVKIGQTLLKKRADIYKKTGSVKAKTDLAENNIKHLEDSQKNAIDIIKKNNNWQMVDCAPRGEILGLSDINDLIYAKLNNKLKKLKK